MNIFSGMILNTNNKKFFAFCLVLLFYGMCCSFAYAQEVQKVFDGAVVERKKDSAAYEVLGRNLTQAEEDLYGDLTSEEIKNELLHREQRLVVVRALLAVGEAKIVKEILEIMPLSELRTFKELVSYFKDLQEKYGSVIEGIRTEVVYNIKDDEEAFKKAAIRAYETVFCIKPQDQDVPQVINFLKQKEAFTYSQMVKSYMNTLTPEDKKEMLFSILDKVGRPDLKNNKVFVEKMLAQEFNCENLEKLLQQLAPKKKPPKKK